jgi:hypothetical protein
VALRVATRDAMIPLLILGVGLFPPNLYMLGLVLKDVHMVAALTLAIGLLLGVRARPSILGYAGALAALAYACAMRHNGFVAVTPLAMWCGTLLARHVRAPLAHTRLGRATIGVAIAGLLFGSAVVVRHGLMAGSTYQYQLTMVHDLAAISIAEGTYLVPPDYWRQPIDQRWPDELENLEILFDPLEGQTLFFPDPPRVEQGGTPFEVQYAPAVIDRLRTTWRRQILDHPGAYLRHRLGLFQGMVTAFSFPERPDTFPNAIGLEFPKTRLNQKVQTGLALLEKTTLFCAWPYLVVLLVVAAALPRAAADLRGPLATIAASGILFQLTFLVGAFTAVFKYNWWMIEASLVAGAICAPRLAEALVRAVRRTR